jgi:hypothetical protein
MIHLKEIAHLFDFEVGDLILASVLILSWLGLIVFIRGITQAMKESKALKLDATALVSGDLMP